MKFKMIAFILIILPLFSFSQEWITTPSIGQWTIPPSSDYVGCGYTFSADARLIWKISGLNGKTAEAVVKKENGSQFSYGGEWEVRKYNPCGELIASGSYSAGITYLYFSFTPDEDAEYVVVLNSDNGGKYYTSAIKFDYTMCSSISQLSTPTLEDIDIDQNGNVTIYAFNNSSEANLARIQIKKNSSSGFDVYTGWHCDVNDPNYTDSYLIYNSEFSIGQNTAYYRTINLSPGIYYVITRVGTSSKKSKYTQPQQFVVCSDPNAYFTYSPTQPKVGETVYFTDNSSISYGNITSWHWDFGDGYSSSSQNSQHSYSSAGTYTVTLTVTNSCNKSDSYSRTITVTEPQPDISLSTSSINFNTVDLGNYSVKSFTIYNYGDATLTINSISSNNNAFKIKRSSDTYYSSYIGSFSISPNRSVTIDVKFTPESAISYSGKLTINSNDPDESYRYVSLSGQGRCPAVSVDLTANTSEIQAGNSVYFTANASSSYGISSYRWNFGDGQTQTTSSGNISHTYNSPGSYDAQVIAYNSCGNSASDLWHINVFDKPLINSVSVSNIMQNSATIDFSVNPNGKQTTVSLYFGTSPDNLSFVQSKDIGNGFNVVNGSFNLSSLQSLTDYYYYIKAENTAGITNSSIEHFTTRPGDCAWYDCRPGDTYYEEMKYLCQKGIIQGYSDYYLHLDDQIIREDVAKILFVGLFGSKDQTTPADNYPQRFEDLINEQNEYYRFPKVLAYLTYDDPKAAFDLDRVYFNPGDHIKRKYYVKAILEAFNIKPVDYPTSVYFTDVSPNDPMFPYIQKAAQIGLINTTNQTFRPEDNITRLEAFLILYRLLHDHSDLIPSQEELQNPDNYIKPTDYSQRNLALAKDISQGNFTHFESSDLFINNGVMPVGFSHNYLSALVDLPMDFNLIQYFSPGWTHNYNIYLIKTQNVPGSRYLVSSEKLIYIVWPDGHFDVFKDQSGYPGIGFSRYLTLQKISDNEFVLTTQDFTKFYFKRLVDNPQAPYQIVKIVDRNGNYLRFAYNEEGTVYLQNYKETLPYRPKLLTKVIDQFGRGLIFNYITKGKYKLLSSVSELNVLGRKVSFQYTEMTVSENGVNKTIYLLTGYTDRMGHQTIYKYGNAFHLPEANFDNKTNPEFLLTYIKDAEGNIINAGYYQRRANYLKTKTKTQNSFVVKSSYDPVSKISNVKTEVLDQYNNLVSGTQRNYTITYTNDGTIQKVTTPTGNSEVLSWYTVDGLKLFPKTVKSLNLTYNYTYDLNLGVVTKLTITGEQGSSISESYEYGNDIFLDSYTDPDGNTTYFRYDQKYNLTQIVLPYPGGTYRMEYNSYGVLTKIIDPEGNWIKYDDFKFALPQKLITPLNTVRYAYDNAGRLIGTYLRGSDGDYILQAIRYNDNDQIIESILSGKGLKDRIITKFDYYNNGKLKAITNPRGRKTYFTYHEHTGFLKSVSSVDATVSYTYYADGKLHTIIKPDGTVFEFIYDDKDRLVKTLINGNDYAQIVYDNYNRISEYHSFLNIGGTEKEIIYTYQYDDLNRPISIKTNGTDEFRYSYYNSGKIKSLTYPDGLVVNYSYYPNGLLKSITWDSYTITYEYFANGSIKKITYPNNVVSTYDYYPETGLLRYNIVKNTSTNAIIYAQGYKYNEFGELVKIATKEPDFSNPDNLPQPKTINYTYDIRDRLISDDGNNARWNINGELQAYKNKTYDFDKAGNLIAVSENGVKRFRYIYDALGRRIYAARPQGNSIYIYGLSNNELQEKIGNKTSDYIWGPGLVARVNRTYGKVYFYHYDHRGNTVALTDQTGQITHKYKYDDFGNLINIEEPAGETNLYRFMGQYGITYEASDLYYVHARYYNPQWGRFLSQDPIWQNNLYAYAGNNPVMNIDPSGENLSIGYNYGFKLGSWYHKICTSISSEKFCAITTEIPAGSYNIIKGDRSNFKFYHIYIMGETSDYELSTVEFIKRISTLSDKYCNEKNEKGKACKISCSKLLIGYQCIYDFSHTKFPNSLGNATIIFDYNGMPIGLYDIYDFNPGSRGFFKELIVGAVNGFNPSLTGYKIIYYNPYWYYNPLYYYIYKISKNK